MQQAVAESEEDGFGMTSSVVADSFCERNTKEVIVKKKYDRFFIRQRYELSDTNGNLLLQVEGPSLSLHKRRVMRDASGSLVLTMRQKVNLLTLRHRWTVNSGKSSDQKDLIFGVQRSHPLEMKPRLDVFMPETGINGDDDNNRTSRFQLVKTYSDLCCRVYRDDSVIAEVTEGLPSRSFFKYKDSFRVKISGGVDYAFIFALIVIFTVNDYI
ncbi:protein LURP-one-related 14-like [Neltuma alba]|uniref:protein LURP-one-related 14-like n=1 Tax=Neltuma alba TaxID=207710 RepID=UPI0010A453C9|nr:protein LURP-one-related 14-like [Prosopis alba]